MIRDSGERARLSAEIGGLLAGNEEAAAMFAARMQAGEVWLALRERCKGNNIRTIHEMRMCFDALGRRMEPAGHRHQPPDTRRCSRHGDL
ncbi:MAG: hypothetical protein P8N02_19705 [Actinomycetota bacterium]|jgi:hypothetical protein|nr:hypothetical protein [Actinomycetota bacterium]